jgi:3-phenylpropionate/trans-cinnamate dioxygenase ferredoxin reductase subunit
MVMQQDGINAPRILIVGAGQAGHQMAASIRDQGLEGPITLIGDEAYPPYQRPPLSKAYLAEDATADLGLEALQFRPTNFYTERMITLRLSCSAAAIDRAGRRLRLSNGETLPYDHLVLATGARNRRLSIPGADLTGVMQLRGLDDAFALRHRLASAKRVAVIGAGFIGLECAATAAKHGAQVTVIEAADRVMGRAVSSPVSTAFQAAHEASGVCFRFGATAQALLGESCVTGLRLADGSVIEADLVIVGIGVLANQELAAAAGLAVDNGILVDAQLCSSDPAISAIGDCARFPSSFADGLIRLESVQNAVDQAKSAAARLAGKPADYAALPWFWSDQGVLKLQIAGLAIGCDRTVIRRHPTRAESFSAFCFKADRLLAVESVNSAAEHMLARQILTAGFHPTPDQIADPAIDLKAALALYNRPGPAV